MSRRVVAPVLLLLAAALSIAAVFAVQLIEEQGGPLAEPWATTYFSPDADGESDIAQVRFTTRRPESVTVRILRAGGRTVRTLARDRRIDGRATLEWDGLDDDGVAVEEGEYHVRITRAGDDRAYSPPRATVVDVTAPVGRLDRATWEAGELRGLALLEPGTRIAVLASDDEQVELDEMRAFHPKPSARSAQPEGRRVTGTAAVRFTIPVDASVLDLQSLSIVAIDLAGNRTDLLEAPDAPTIRVLD